MTAVRFNTKRSPASLLCSEACDAEVIQRDAAFAAINFVSGHEGQCWKKILAEVAKKFLFLLLSLPCYLLIPLEACWHQRWQQALSLAGGPRQDPDLSRAQQQRFFCGMCLVMCAAMKEREIRLKNSQK